MRYYRGHSRYQQSILSADDLVSKSNIVRTLDELCEDFVTGVTTEKGLKETGRKAYHPADLLKILVYAYFNGISSSRKMERECQRNIELKWLINDINPDHKTISDFRKDNGELISKFFNHLIIKFKELGLIVGKSIAVDGTKIKGYGKREINIEGIKEKLANIEQQTEKYLKDLDTLDKLEDEIEEGEKKKAELIKELEELESKKKSYQHLEAKLKASGQKKICITDEDSKMMRGRYGKYYGYNVQSSVDTQHHLITCIEVTNNQNDKGLLTPVIEVTQEITGEKAEECIADAGYYKITELEELEKQGTQCYVAINRTPSQVKDEAEGITFTYDSTQARYYCQQGKSLEFFRSKTVEGRKMAVYKGTACNTCAIRSRCTKSTYRTVHRSENQQWIDSYHEKMKNEGKEKLKQRSSVVEHPFGTMRYYMGQIPLVLRNKAKVQIEMNLYAIGYNLKRYIKLAGIKNETSNQTEAKLAA